MFEPLRGVTPFSLTTTAALSPDQMPSSNGKPLGKLPTVAPSKSEATTCPIGGLRGGLIVRQRCVKHVVLHGHPLRARLINLKRRRNVGVLDEPIVVYLGDADGLTANTYRINARGTLKRLWSK